MSITLIDLPYNKDALQPYISSETIDFHYGKHHQTYVNNLNNLIKDTDLENKNLIDIIKISYQNLDKMKGIFNNAAQIFNHDFYFHSMTNKSYHLPDGEILSLINDSFSSYDKFKESFASQAIANFGSGWTWLVADKNKKLSIISTSNAETIVTTDFTPLLTIDVWEHAYYIDYRNVRKKYVEDFVNHLINWNFAQENLDK